MTDYETIQPNNCPLCTNILRLGAYLLAPDEVIFFDWLTMKQVSFGEKYGYDTWFYYSYDRILSETRIKRTRLEVMIKRFQGMGILNVETRAKPNEVGRTRFFRMAFDGVKQKLPEIIDQGNDAARAFREYFSALSRLQGKASKEHKKPHQQEWQEERAKTVLCNLNAKYSERVRRYNDGKMTNGVPPTKAKMAVSFPNNKDIMQRIANVARIYKDDDIVCAFTAFADEYLTGERNIKSNNILAAFLRYDAMEQRFPYVDDCLMTYQTAYSRPNPKAQNRSDAEN